MYIRMYNVCTIHIHMYLEKNVEACGDVLETKCRDGSVQSERLSGEREAGQRGVGSAASASLHHDDIILHTYHVYEYMKHCT